MGDVLDGGSSAVNSELLALMYGSLVTQLLKDADDVPTVNLELERLGFETGVRMVDEFLAKMGNSGTACSDFSQTCETIAKQALKMFLGITGEVTQITKGGNVCHIQFGFNPLAEFVEIPTNLSELKYSNFLCGAIRGALEQIHIKVAVEMVKDQLQGADTNELRLELVELLKEEFVDMDDRDH